MKKFLWVLVFGLWAVNSWAETASSEYRDLSIPSYTYLKPRWGLELAASLNAFGGTALTSAQGTNPAYGFSAHFDYQIPFQKFGILGVGPSLALYPIMGGTVTSSVFSVFSAGAQIRYQARYFREQPVLPMVGYAVEYMSYRFISGGNGWVLAKGPVLGIWVLLNWIEPSAASDFYVDAGILRSYLVVEWRALAGSDSNISFQNGSYYFGIRLEF